MYLSTSSAALLVFFLVPHFLFQASCLLLVASLDADALVQRDAPCLNFGQNGLSHSLECSLYLVVVLRVNFNEI